jgi:hypothetical protein
MVSPYRSWLKFISVQDVISKSVYGARLCPKGQSQPMKDSETRG